MRHSQLTILTLRFLLVHVFVVNGVSVPGYAAVCLRGCGAQRQPQCWCFLATNQNPP